jgi:hypothetical protein
MVGKLSGWCSKNWIVSKCILNPILWQHVLNRASDIWRSSTMLPSFSAVIPIDPKQGFLELTSEHSFSRITEMVSQLPFLKDSH